MPARTRVLLLGYGAVACSGLEALRDGGVEVVGVVPRAADRGYDPVHSLFSRARALGLRVFEVKGPNGRAFVEEARALEPDYLVSLQYDRILRPEIIDVPELGCLNLHFSPLPRLRGCFPTKWAILEDEPSGVTFHWIDPGVDTGAIVDQIGVPLAPDETDATLYAKLQRAGAELFAKQVAAIAAGAVPAGSPQDESRASYHPKQTPHAGEVDWTRDARFVERLVRAFTSPPHPGARTRCAGHQVELRAPVAVREASELGPGEVAFEYDGSVAIGCGGGAIVVRRLWIDGEKRPAAALRLLAGARPRFERDA